MNYMIEGKWAEKQDNHEKEDIDVQFLFVLKLRPKEMKFYRGCVL